MDECDIYNLYLGIECVNYCWNFKALLFMYCIVQFIQYSLALLSLQLEFGRLYGRHLWILLLISGSVPEMSDFTSQFSFFKSCSVLIFVLYFLSSIMCLLYRFIASSPSKITEFNGLGTTDVYMIHSSRWLMCYPLPYERWYVFSPWERAHLLLLRSAILNSKSHFVRGTHLHRSCIKSSSHFVAFV